MKLRHYIDGKLQDKYHGIKDEHKKNEKKYKFYLDNIANNIYITDRLIFIRENDEYIFTLKIGETNEANIKLLKENNIFDIKVISASYTEKDKYIDIKYKLETDNKNHHIILEIEE